MPALALGLEPEVEALVREIARDERSTLFGVPNRKVTRFAATGGRADHTGLTKAERHLLRTHSIEVAEALRRVCVDRLWANPNARYLMMGSAPEPQRMETPVQTQAQVYSQSVGATSTPLPSRSTLDEPPGDEWAAGQALEGHSVIQIAAASIRLYPTDQARIYAALDLMYAGSMDSARSLLATIACLPSSRLTKSYALSNLGCIESHTARHSQAFLAYMEATRLAPERPAALMSGMVSAAVAGHQGEAIQLARLVSAQFPVGHSAVRKFIHFITLQRQRRHPRLGDGDRGSLARLRGTVSGSSRRILNDILHH